MAKITVNTDLTTFPITRQTLFDMWANGTLSGLGQSDMAPDFQPILVASGPSNFPAAPHPGAHIWDSLRQHMYVFHDAVDNTGVSLWLASGPDKFETAALAAEPLAAGAILAPVYDRIVQVYNPTNETAVHYNIVGLNQSGVPTPYHSHTPETAASGTWVAMGIEGFLDGFARLETALSGLYYLSGGPAQIAPDQLQRVGAFMASDPTGGFNTPDFDPFGFTVQGWANPESEPGFIVMAKLQFTGLRKFNGIA